MPMLAGRSRRRSRWARRALLAVGVCTVDRRRLPAELRRDAGRSRASSATTPSTSSTAPRRSSRSRSRSWRSACSRPVCSRGRTRGCGGSAPVTAVAGVLWIGLQRADGRPVPDRRPRRRPRRASSTAAARSSSGVWLIAVAVSLPQRLAARSRCSSPRGAMPSPGLGRIDGDGEAAQPVRLPRVRPRVAGLGRAVPGLLGVEHARGGRRHRDHRRPRAGRSPRGSAAAAPRSVPLRDVEAPAEERLGTGHRRARPRARRRPRPRLAGPARRLARDRQEHDHRDGARQPRRGRSRRSST